MSKPDAYWLEVGGRSPGDGDPGVGASLGPYVSVEAAEADARAIKGWTLGQLEDRGVGRIDTYGRDAIGRPVPAAMRDEVVRWATVREQWVDRRDSEGVPTTWIPGDTETVYDDFIVLYEKCADCHLFVEPNDDAHLPGVAAYVHLARGDAHDDALDGNHEPRPSGERHTIDHWREHGPYAMRARFEVADNEKAGASA